MKAKVILDVLQQIINKHGADAEISTITRFFPNERYGNEIRYRDSKSVVIKDAELLIYNEIPDGFKLTFTDAEPEFQDSESDDNVFLTVGHC